MSVKRNIIANFFGRGWSALASLMFIPLYIHYLGIEAYGVIGFYASLMSALTLLDFGMGQTMVRETARASDSEFDKRELIGLLGTLEYVYLSVGALAAFMTWLLSEWFAGEWLSAREFDLTELTFLVQIMGLVAAARWAASPYRSTLIGLQSQVWLNVFEAFFVTVRGIGVIAVLALLSDSVVAFFIYQGLVSIIEVIALRLKAWNAISGQCFVLPIFDFGQLRRIGKFAGGVATISLLGSGISQMDKLLLPGLVSLKVFGYYMVAHALGRAIIQFSFPVATAYRPVFAKLVVNKQPVELSKQYHKSSQLMALVVIPAAVVIAVFSEQLLWLWTGNREIALEAGTLVSLLTIGTMLNGLVTIPYSIQLAYGYLKLALLVNLLAAIILVPAFYYAVDAYGVISAGWIWLILNLIYVVINVSYMHKKYLIGDAMSWYLKDNLPSIISSAAVAFTLFHFTQTMESFFLQVCVILTTLIMAISISVLVTPYSQQKLLRMMRLYMTR